MSTPDGGPPARQRVVIIGGGVGAMTTALELTATPELRARYTVSVYQEGWRLGGKGASGRNAAVAQRIEEHGLHIWSGFYVNALRAMRQVYAEAQRPASCPLGTFEQAFSPHNNVSWQENFLDRWRYWVEELEERPDEKPGEPSGPIPTPFRLLLRMATWAIRFLLNVKRDWKQDSSRVRHPGWPAGCVAVWDALRLAGTLGSFAFLYLTNHLAHFATRILRRPVATATPSAETNPDHLLDHFLARVRRRILHELEAQPDALRLVILLDAACCIGRSMLFDGLLWRGFDCLDNEDFRAWFLRHGAIPEITVNSGLVRGTYDYIFAYEEGDTTRPSLAAGVALRMTLRLLLTYQRSIFWRMEAGMGDTIFAPMYEVLKRRGVAFHFFHRIENLGVAPDRQSIDRIRVARQVTLAGGRRPTDYDPLVDVGGVPCWPTEPNYHQIDPEQAAQLQADTVNLCSPWSTWKPVEVFELVAGRDFDCVVLGASLAALPLIGPELLAPDTGSEALRLLHRHVQTVPTLAMQLWLQPDAPKLGWHEGATILTGYAEPFDTWADMTHLLPREQWPAGLRPGNLSYFCGPLHVPQPPPVFGTHPEYPEQVTLEVRRLAGEWLDANAGPIWPGSRSDGEPDTFDRNRLVSLAGGDPDQRFEAQYFRGNVIPSDRYVISLPGTTRYRLRPHESGYRNLILTGDWVRTGLNYGCVEATVMAGMAAARAICGSPELIYGETDFSPAP